MIAIILSCLLLKLQISTFYIHLILYAVKILYLYFCYYYIVFL